MALAKNIALAIGKLGLYNSRQIADSLPKITKNWSLTIRLISDKSEEKHHAFKGFLMAIEE